MNFKNLTKIAAVAVLFVSIPAFAVIQDSPFVNTVNLYIQNNTNYNLDIMRQVPNETTYKVGTLKANEFKHFTNLPFKKDFWGLDHYEINFLLKDSSSGAVLAITTLFFDASDHTVTADMVDSTNTTIVQTDIIEDINFSAYDNQYTLHVTINGDKENNFDDSTIELEAGVPKA